jgi:hypothetical protein
MNVSLQANQITSANDPSGSARDHCCVVRAKGVRGKGNRHFGTAPFEHLPTETVAKERVCRDAAGEHDCSGAEFGCRSCCLDREWFDNSRLIRGGKVGDGRIRCVCRWPVLSKGTGRAGFWEFVWGYSALWYPHRFRESEERCLETREAEVIGVA